jgi:hypothetical protein
MTEPVPAYLVEWSYELDGALLLGEQHLAQVTTYIVEHASYSTLTKPGPRWLGMWFEHREDAERFAKHVHGDVRLGAAHSMVFDTATHRKWEQRFYN